MVFEIRRISRQALASLVALLSLTTLGMSQTTVGSIKTVAGQVSVERRGQTIDVKEGLLLFGQDSVRTGPNARVGIILRDGSRFSLGPNSELVIEKFEFEPAERRLGMLMRLVKGMAAYVSGQLAQMAPNSSQIETPVGVIGLRGTQIAITLDPQ